MHVHAINVGDEAFSSFLIPLGDSILKEDKAVSSLEVHSVDGKGLVILTSRLNGAFENLHHVFGREVLIQISQKDRTKGSTPLDVIIIVHRSVVAILIVNLVLHGDGLLCLPAQQCPPLDRASRLLFARQALLGVNRRARGTVEELASHVLQVVAYFVYF